MSPRLVENAAECVLCHKVIRSVHRHDFRGHDCQWVAMGHLFRVSFFVDGGLDYTRRLWGGPGLSNKPGDHFIERSRYEEVPSANVLV